MNNNALLFSQLLVNFFG